MRFSEGFIPVTYPRLSINTRSSEGCQYNGQVKCYSTFANPTTGTFGFYTEYPGNLIPSFRGKRE